MKWQNLLLLVLLGINGFFVAGANAKEFKMPKILDKDRGLEYQLEVLKDKDDGVYGLLVSVANLNKNDVSLSIPAEPTEFVMASIIQKGKVISMPPKIYATDGKERPKLSKVVVPKLGSYEWFVPIGGYIQNKENLKSGVKGLLSVTLVVDFKPINMRKESDSSNVSIGSSDKELLLFTSQALEGNPYDKFKDRKNKAESNGGQRDSSTK